MIRPGKIILLIFPAIHMKQRSRNPALFFAGLGLLYLSGLLCTWPNISYLLAASTLSWATIFILFSADIKFIFWRIWPMDIPPCGRRPRRPGFPFFSSPLAQYFYPFNIPLVLWHKLAGGYSILDHELFTIFGLSIFGLGLYCWLKRLQGNLAAALFSTLIMTVSFRLTESPAFPQRNSYRGLVSLDTVCAHADLHDVLH